MGIPFFSLWSENSILIVFAPIALANIFLITSLRKGNPVAWHVQMVLSLLGLLGFPIQTVIHALVLSKWFKPDTKAWFGLS